MVDDGFDLYMEIVAFMDRCGGPYRVIDPETCVNLIESLENGQYVIHRDEGGQIISFLNYWRVDDAGIPAILTGGKPENICDGRIIYVVDCCNLSGMVGIIGLLKEVRRRYPKARGGAWFHKQKTPENFRFFPLQRGEHG